MKFTSPVVLRLATAASGLLCFGASLHAQSPETPSVGWVQATIWEQLFHCTLFGLLGILLVTFGFKIFDKIITRIDLEEEVLRGNMAAAVLSAAAILAIGIIIASAIH